MLYFIALTGSKKAVMLTPVMMLVVENTQKAVML